MITCKEIIQTLTAYLEDDLSPEERVCFEQQIDECGPSMALFRPYEKSSELATQALRMEDIPDELRDWIHGFLKEKLGLRG